MIPIDRFVDSVPVSRNENIAGFMHKCGICEERGSGYDKIVKVTGENELLAPKIENQNDQFTKVVLFQKVPFDLVAKEDKIRTCYMQACLAHVNLDGITNSYIRHIFGLSDREMSKASRIISNTMSEGLIKPMDTNAAPKYMKYVPYWA